LHNYGEQILIDLQYVHRTYMGWVGHCAYGMGLDCLHELVGLGAENWTRVQFGEIRL